MHVQRVKFSHTWTMDNMLYYLVFFLSFSFGMKAVCYILDANILFAMIFMIVFIVDFASFAASIGTHTQAHWHTTIITWTQKKRKYTPMKAHDHRIPGEWRLSCEVSTHAHVYRNRLDSPKTACLSVCISCVHANEYTHICMAVWCVWKKLFSIFLSFTSMCLFHRLLVSFAWWCMYIAWKHKEMNGFSTIHHLKMNEFLSNWFFSLLQINSCCSQHEDIGKMRYFIEEIQSFIHLINIFSMTCIREMKCFFLARQWTYGSIELFRLICKQIPNVAEKGGFSCNGNATYTARYIPFWSFHFDCIVATSHVNNTDTVLTDVPWAEICIHLHILIRLLVSLLKQLQRLRFVVFIHFKP